LTKECRWLEAVPRIEMRTDVCDDVFDGFRSRRIGRRCLNDYSEFEGILESDVRMGVVECFDDCLREFVPIERVGVVNAIADDGAEVAYTAALGDTGLDLPAGRDVLCVRTVGGRFHQDESLYRDGGRQTGGGFGPVLRYTLVIL
jgi:hypothetical protein